MPPQVKVSKEAIVDKAFELTRLHGFEKVTARMLASELECSTQPVFHVFRNMSELKDEVYKKTQKYFEDYMLRKPVPKDTPYFLNMGLRYVELAQKEKNLFHLLCTSEGGEKIRSFQDLGREDPLKVDPEVFIKTWIFTHGIASIVSGDNAKISNKEIRKMLTEASKSFSIYHKDDHKEGSR